MIVYNHECEFDCDGYSFRSPEAFLLTGSGTKTRANFEVPYENYVKESQYAVVKGQLFIFGGGNPAKFIKIAKLEGCSFVELPVQLNFAVDSNSAALSIDNGEKGTQKLEKYNKIIKPKRSYASKVDQTGTARNAKCLMEAPQRPRSLLLQLVP